MKPRNKSERDMLKCCEQLHSDDGISIRHQKNQSYNVKEHKIERLCAQIQKGIRLAISEHCLTTILSHWDADSVRPGEKTSALVVKMVQVGGEPDNPELVRALLAQYQGVIRNTVAETITRKKTPSLRFHLIEGESVEGECDDS